MFRDAPPRPQPVPLLEFMVQQDGTQPEVSAAEQSAVAVKFNSIVDDLLLSNIDRVTHLKHISEDTLRMRTPVDSQGGRWHIWVHDRTEFAKTFGDTLEDAENPYRDITLRYIDNNGYGRTAVDYRIGREGIARRWDHGDAWLKKFNELPEEPEEPVDTVFIGSIGSYLAAELVAFDPDKDIEPFKNNRLEQTMGLNCQPTGLAEITSLEEFMNQPGVEVIAA